MSGVVRVAVRAVAVAVAAVSVLGATGCRDGGSTALPSPAPPTAASADPLTRVENELDALERDVAVRDPDVEGGPPPTR